MFTEKKKLFLIITILFVMSFVSVSLYADCDMMAMIAKKGHYISWVDSNTGDYDDPYDLFNFIRDRSSYGSNHDGYGFLYYKDNGEFFLDPDDLGHNDENPGHPLNQAWYQIGSGTYYTGGSVDYKWELNKAEEVIMDNGTDATLVIGHARLGTVGDGNHPFRLEIENDPDKVYSFMCKIFTRCLHFLDKNTLSISQLELNRQFLYEVLPNYSNL